MKDKSCKIPNNLTNVSSLSAGSQYVLALKNDGTIVFWGIPDVKEQIPMLVNISKKSKITAISSGCGHALALRDDGTVIARGSNTEGAMDVPANLSDVIAISAGCGGQSLALKMMEPLSLGDRMITVRQMSHHI
jgi:alpha-tubulin suppressor-like RCC1 family protein